MTLIYATSDDYTAEYGTAPANVDRLLKSASRLVTDGTVNDIYVADTAGMPTDAATIEAFKEATIIQASAWTSIGYDPAAGGVITPGTKLSKSLDGASVTYADAAQAAAARAVAANQLVPEAVRVLKQAGLGASYPWSFG